MNKTRASQTTKHASGGVSFCIHSAALAKYDPWTRYRLVEMLGNYVDSPATGKLGLVVEHLVAPFTDEDCGRLLKTLLGHAAKAGIDTTRIKTQSEDASLSVSASIEELVRLPRMEDSLRKELKAAYRRILAGARRPRRCGTGLSGRIRQVQKAFALSDDEADLLLAVYLLEHDKLLELLINGSTGFSAGPRSMLDKVIIISLLSGEQRASTQHALSAHGKLRRMALVDVYLETEMQLAWFLHGLGNKPLASVYFSEYTGCPLPLERHFAVRDHIHVVRELLLKRKPGTPLNILLYGPPGAGKTEFCRALGRDLDWHVYEVAHRDIEDNRKQGHPRYRAIWACVNSVPQKNAIIVVDEADNILNEPFGFLGLSITESDKGMLNNLLDSVSSPLIWITNHYERIAESTRRRFDYALKFPTLTQSQRRCIWQELLVQHDFTGILDDREVADLAASYPLSIGDIERAVRNCRRMLADPVSGGKAFNTLVSLLDSQVKLREATGGPKPVRLRPAAELATEGFNMGGGFSAREIISILRSFTARDHASGSARVANTGNMSLLLQGPPGTGKTEFAKYAASEIERPLIAKTASDLLSCYVGGTEKLIREAFDEATGEEAVLFIDEADSFLQERAGARHSWEVTQVNELLQQMERFRGILICATNFKSRLDSAAMRRFNVKLEFDYLDADGREFFYHRFLESLTEAALTADIVGAVRQIEHLTPGDFRVVRDQFRYLPAQKRTHRQLLEALRSEVRQKNGLHAQPIGFGR